MPEGSFRYCDVSLPVPLDRPFTYSLPVDVCSTASRPAAGCIVPFGVRKADRRGAALPRRNRRQVEARDALRLVDAEPVLDAELLSLARWIAAYYCAPLGEVLALHAAAGERGPCRQSIFADRRSGLDAARQLLLDAGPEDPVAADTAHAGEAPALGGLSDKEVSAGGQSACARSNAEASSSPSRSHAERDPLRAPSERLRVELEHEPDERKLPKAERELHRVSHCCIRDRTISRRSSRRCATPAARPDRWRASESSSWRERRCEQRSQRGRCGRGTR